MTFESKRLDVNVSDNTFDAIYPRTIRKLTEKHFTPVAVAKRASEFLIRDQDTKVLDIGSGAGKFCLVGAAHTSGHFTGIEQRQELVTLSTELAVNYGLTKLTFINANVTSIDFTDYDAFYLFNSFYENIDVNHKIDNSVLVNPPLYNAYTMHTVDQLQRCPAGTRLATYYTPSIVVPKSFELIESLFDGHLHLWEKG